MQLAIPRANVHRKLPARAATKRISKVIALATKCVNVAKNMATTRYIVSNHDAKHAAGQTTETLVLSLFECPERKFTKCEGTILF